MQTAHPLARGIVFVLGCAAIAIGVFAWGRQTLVAILMIASGSVVCFLGLIGRKESVDDILLRMGEEFASRLLESILDGLF